MVELYIGGEMIEAIPVKLDECRTYEYRKEKVHSAMNWLRYKYRGTIEIKDNWVFILSIGSRMNEPGFEVEPLDVRMLTQAIL